MSHAANLVEQLRDAEECEDLEDEIREQARRKADRLEADL